MPQSISGSGIASWMVSGLECLMAVTLTVCKIVSFSLIRLHLLSSGVKDMRCPTIHKARIACEPQHHHQAEKRQHAAFCVAHWSKTLMLISDDLVGCPLLLRLLRPTTPSLPEAVARVQWVEMSLSMSESRAASYILTCSQCRGTGAKTRPGVTSAPWWGMQRWTTMQSWSRLRSGGRVWKDTFGTSCCWCCLF